MALINTINFLPAAFRSSTNQRFLGATLDQLVTDAVDVPLNGYIGRTLAPTYKLGDNYIPEPSNLRAHYQLEPSVVVKDNAGDVVLNSLYTDLLQSIDNNGGFINNHQRLFNSVDYNYDSQIDYDKFVNYSQYYWIPGGPDPVTVTSGETPFQAAYTVNRNTSVNGYTFSGVGGHPNTQLTLTRGGTYTFTVNQPGYKFWIQTQPGVSGLDPNISTVSTRQVYGVSNNGTDDGVITFNVPLASAQNFYSTMVIAATVNAAVTFNYTDIQNQLLSSFLTKFPDGLDGITNLLQNKQFVFIGNQVDNSLWTTPNLPPSYTSPNTSAILPGQLISNPQRTNVWQINLLPTTTAGKPDYLIQINPVATVNAQQKVFISSGKTYASTQFWLNNNFLYNTVPPVTSISDYLYYQDSSNPEFVGQIKLVDNISTPINVDLDINGQSSYTSPNGVIFTNGLKIQFDSLVSPATYAGNQYYVEGVGSKIQLVPVAQLAVPESFAEEIETTADYITINRSSQDQNAWTRSNSWFHVDVLNATAAYNQTLTNYGPNIQGRRAIIEFEPNLQLFNFGTQAKNNVDLLCFSLPAQNIIIGGTYTIVTVGTTDFTTFGASSNTVGVTFTATRSGNSGDGTGTTSSDAFVQIEGQVSFAIDGVTLTPGMRIVFANDHDVTVINEVWQVIFQVIDNANYITLVETGDDPVFANQNILITQGVNSGKTYRYTGTDWFECQEKTSLNQAPLFDLLNADGISFGDNTVYPNSTFEGTRLFGYTMGTGSVDDTVLGFPLVYENFNNIGDIQFTNYYDTDTFTYNENGTVISVNCNTGYALRNSGLSSSVKVNNWIPGVENTKQYQVVTKFYEGYVVDITSTVTALYPAGNQVPAGTYAFVQIDILPEDGASIPYVKVYQNNQLLEPTVDYNIVPYGVYYIVVLTATPAVGDKIDVSIFSTDVSGMGYYEIPKNLDYNPLNSNFDTITLGQLRTHYNKLIENTNTTSPAIPNRDRNLKAQGGILLQQSSPLIYAMTFLTDPTVNFINGITLARKEYQRFKNKFLSLCSTLKTLDYKDPVSGVNTILTTINQVKNSSFPWYYSDMLAQDGSFTTTTYTVLNQNQTRYEINSIFNTTTLSNRSVLVYLNNVQLIAHGIDFSFSTNTPEIIINTALTVGDTITIRDYSNTDGCYIPETPTKLGLYPNTPPAIYIDDTYLNPTVVIRGHDGSVTPAFTSVADFNAGNNDFRDDYLIELEKRIYNNLKTDYINLNILDPYDIIPGRFRNTDYSLLEWNQLLTQNFLQWTGSNNIDYTTNTWYDANNPWTWNYDQYADSVDGSLLQGSWRAIYKYWYDTDQPNLAPWEMLGFSEMPSWWATRYGPSPYTSGNTTLWEDLENGYIWNGSNAAAYKDARFARPGLTGILTNSRGFIPVDNAGNLLDPTRIGIIGKYSNTSSNSFQVGQHGPVETAWRRSSDYPYAIQQALALARPAEYFSTQLDLSRFYINPITGQFSSASNQKISPTLLKVNGDTTSSPGSTLRTSGYLNWISDYIKNLGMDPVSTVEAYFKNFNVQLAYRVAGFTDQNLITVTAEQTSPGSTNASIIIPNENYTVYLGTPVPISTIVYSGVVVTRTDTGYSVAGYDTSNPFFNILPSIANNQSKTITVNNLSVKVYETGSTEPTAIPYGTNFATAQQVADFLISYQRFMVSQGFSFTVFDTDLEQTRNWELSVQEFLFWVQQGWAPGTILVLNPVHDQLLVNTKTAIIDEVSNLPNGSRILNTNFAPIKSNSFDILRIDNPAGNLFQLRTVDGLSGIAFAQLNLIQYENTLIFDNIDDFGDIIYVPEQGTRQYRLKLNGSKTGLWDGALSPTGYIYSNPVIDAWQAGIDYRQGDIVIYNNSYYTAPIDIPASQNFALSNWTQIAADSIQTGLLPSFGYNAQIFQQIYDVDNPPADKNFQTYSSSLIGFRERPFLSNLGISAPTQTKFYQGYIKQKGTANAIDSLTKSTFDTVNSTIRTYEEWALQVGRYGDINNNPYTEFILDQSVFLTNPAAFTITANTYNTANIIVDLAVSSNVYNASNLLSTTTGIYSNRTADYYASDLPTAGYVNLADVNFQIFDINTITTVPTVEAGNKIWTAKGANGNWNVYRITEINTAAIALRYTLDSYAQLTFTNPPGLVVGDYFVLQKFNSAFDGLYQVLATPNSLTLTIQVNNVSQLVKKNSLITGSGSAYVLRSSITNSIENVNQLRPPHNWITGDKLWVNSATNEGWGVYSFNSPWANNAVKVTANTITNNSKFGYATATSTDNQWIYIGNPGTGSVQVFANVDFNYSANANIASTDSNFGSSIDTQGGIVVVGAPGSANVHVYAHTGGTYTALQTLSSAYSSDNYGTSVALSGDRHWLYVSEPGTAGIYTYWTANIGANAHYSFVTGITGLASVSSNFGSAIKTNHDGSFLYVGAPQAFNVDPGNGNVYIISRSANSFSLAQTITSQEHTNSAGFGTSLAVDSLGGNLFVGVPNSNAFGFADGVVERWINQSGTYVFEQAIPHPANAMGSFGSSMSISSDGQVLAIGSANSATVETTTFDQSTTVIDENSTKFIDSVYESGSVYMFEPLVDQTDVDSVGVYSYTSQLEAQVNTGDQFGYSISASRGSVVVGAIGAANNSGDAYIFSNDSEVTAWTISRQQQPAVDITSINRTFIYNKTTNVILSALDFIDPAKGKVLNAVGVDIDYQLATDPAIYNAGSTATTNDYHWGPNQVGKIWWDLNAIRYINYEQDALIYRLNHWAERFPGSQVNVYEWVESPVPPSQYVATVGDGVPLATDNSAYSTYGYVTAAGSVNVKYYFWVGNKTTINTAAGKSNSAYSIAAAIENPSAQGIPYATVLRDDTIALYNINGVLTGQNSILHLGSHTANSGLIHSEYALVQEGNPESQIPAAIEAKIIDSLTGMDIIGNPVPDPALTPAQAYGINIRPRQSMFINQALALSNYITFVNSVLITYPVLERKLTTTLNSGEAVPAPGSGAYSQVIENLEELGYVDTTLLSNGYTILVNSDSSQNNKWSIYTLGPLGAGSFVPGAAYKIVTVGTTDYTLIGAKSNTVGLIFTATGAGTGNGTAVGTINNFSLSRIQNYKTNLYWNAVDWYQPGYDYTVEPTVTVNNKLDFGKLTLQANTYVKILNNGNNQFEIYYIDDSLTPNLYGIQTGTLQISTGTIPALEMRQLALAIQKNIFIDDLAAEYNQLFFVMVKYALTEQKNLEWVFKTSFLSATQYIRALVQFPSYIADNQQYYLDYINEVKPYRTVVREFVVDYQGSDQYPGDTTDFDLPSYWDANLQVYRSPDGSQTYDSTLISGDGAYAQWYNNYTYNIVNVTIEEPGTGYLFPPQVTISGTTGSGATAYSVLNGLGGISEIVITNPGKGYTTIPDVIIIGTGSGAKGRAVLNNVFDGDNTGHNVVRSINTTLKFDRITYTTTNTFVFWDTITANANIGQTLTANTIIVNNSQPYLLNNNYTITGNTTTNTVNFPLANVTALSSTSFSNANDRIVAYNGFINLALTQSGLEYPGVILDGSTYFAYESAPTWTADTSFGVDSILLYSGNAYQVLGNVNSTDFNSISGNLRYLSGANAAVQIDSITQSFYSNVFGVNPSDLAIDGGGYISTFASYAPEELVPGQTFDSVDISVYDTGNLSYREFHDMSSNPAFYRIASANITTLANTLSMTDTEIYVVDASVLASPNPSDNLPGVVFINGEKINFWRNYALETKTPWVANLVINTSSLITYAGNTYITLGSVYDAGGTFANIVTSTQRLTDLNVLTQLRRGVDGTYTPATHATGSRVVDSIFGQEVPGSSLTTANIGLSPITYTTTSNVSYGITLSTPITSNVGDFINQVFANSAVAANLQVLGNVTSSTQVAVVFVSGALTTQTNTITINGSTVAGATLISDRQLGTVSSAGTITLAANTVVQQSNVWTSNNSSLDSSTTAQANFLKASPGFTPAPGTTP